MSCNGSDIMAFSDLRTFIDAAHALGEVKAIDGAHWNLEIGCLTELMAEQDGPLLLFDNIAGYPKGFRIATNVLASARRFALASSARTASRFGSSSTNTANRSRASIGRRGAPARWRSCSAASRQPGSRR